jgi:hypothetical protein
MAMRIIAAAVVLLAFAAPSAADDKVADGFALVGVVTPGTVLSVPGEFTANAVIAVALQPSNSKSAARIVQGQVLDGALKIRVPDDLAPGPYTATFGTNQVIRGGIDVQVAGVKLEAVNPTTSYRSPASTFEFDLIGENFSTDVCNDDVTVPGQGSIVAFRGESRADCGGVPDVAAKAKPCTPGASTRPTTETPQGACLWVDNGRLMHVIGYRAAPYQGPLMVNVRVGNVAALQAQPLVLARRSPAAIFVLSAGATALLFGIVSWTVSRGLKGNKVGSRRLRLTESFIFDPETNSYSLSKFQLLLFSITFLFGYMYVFLTTLLVQWKFTLPDVPQNIAGLLGLSGGTAIAAAGLTAARGSKGAGLQHPTGADLISNGGVVVGERFQFFVWTIVACAGFVMLLISQDPAKVTGFPQIPDGLLYVMGVSAAGYLGGKATRKPGPIIQSIAIDPKPKLEATTPATPNTPAQPAKPDAPAFPMLIVQGQNLASDGRFFVDGKELPIVPDSQRAEGTPKELLKVTPQEGAVDQKFCTDLKIIIACRDVDVTKGDHRFRIVNRDGQFADIAFSAQQPLIMAVFPQGTTPPTPQTKKLPASTETGLVVVRGENLLRGSQVTWQAPGATDPANVTIVDQQGETELHISLVSGKAGTGILAMTTPSGFVTNASVAVDEPSTPVSPSTPTPPAAPAAPTSPTPAPTQTPAPGGAGPSAPSTADHMVSPASSADAGAPAPGQTPGGAGGAGAPSSGSQGSSS